MVAKSPVTINEGCSFSGGGEDIAEVTDGSGSVHDVVQVEIRVDDGDTVNVCGDPREARPVQVGDKHFFTANNEGESVEVEAVTLGRFAWHLLGLEWD